MDPLLAKLTLAIPVFNEERFLREAVESCVGQVGRILLYDNASTDGSGDICASLAAAHPEVTHIRRAENIGAFENFKAPLFECTTEYFCWIGGHDRIAPGYTLHLLRRLEADGAIALAAGTIQHIDEQGAPRKQRTCSRFLDAANQPQPLDRLEALARHLRDCFIFHGVYRTAVLRAAWFDEPCLGFDRITLFRIGVRGKIAYVPEAVIFGRDFPKERAGKEDRKRRSEVIGRTAIAQTNFTRNQQLILTCLGQAEDDASLTRALEVIGIIRRRHHQRRKYQRRRLLWLLGAIAVVGVFIFLLINFRAA
jgi:glycosyltransferase involved in cell wall biosynthesis